MTAGYAIGGVRGGAATDFTVGPVDKGVFAAGRREEATSWVARRQKVDGPRYGQDRSSGTWPVEAEASLAASRLLLEGRRGGLRLAAGYEGAQERARAAECVFWLGYCHEKLNRTEEALGEYRRVSSRCAGTAAARQAGERAARLERGGAP